ncbi:General transcription factor II-I repeat domain-containing protein 2 [Merluccius polli]|uniref:General transcription factor II-I repeat domain-containing protein 2 n=1 Tax=Merluccius polli TaxID=89951 RepID=A0AA47MEI7_MERPO|nr:General transcription factor II-I repeat domain-containing protein 2 [Merluccius polli]
MAEVKKSKTYHFHSEWEEDYFFVYSNSKSICLICNASVALPKKGNLERHFKTVYKSYDTNFPAKSPLRARKVQELKSQLATQQSVFTRPNSKTSSRVLAKRKKPFMDGEIVKEAFLEAADVLFADFKNRKEIVSAIQDMQLSRNSVTRRCEGMAEDVEQQLRNDIDACECFSLQFDKSTDVVDVAQLCVFIRMVFDGLNVKEELLTILPLKGHTRGTDIFQVFMEFVNKSQLPLFKLVSITTDGAPSMVGRTAGFIGLCKQCESFPDFLNYHCIIHQQGLCGKILNMKDVMDVANKIACSVRARSLQRRLFREQLEETGAEHTDLLLHTDVRRSTLFQVGRALALASRFSEAYSGRPWSAPAPVCSSGPFSMDSSLAHPEGRGGAEGVLRALGGGLGLGWGGQLAGRVQGLGRHGPHKVIVALHHRALPPLDDLRVKE